MNGLGSDITGLLEDILAAVTPEQQESVTVNQQALASQLATLSTKFPFSIPWDAYNLLRLVSASPVTPSGSFPVAYSNGQWVYRNISLSDWDSVMAAVRSIEFATFALGLALNTRKLLSNVEVAA